MGNFYPRPPRGGRPLRARTGPVSDDFYPRPPRGGRPAAATAAAFAAMISIHALREEGDVAQGLFLVGGYQFLSTPSARRATQGWHHDHHGQQISIHALREEGDRCFFVFAQSFIISIHALREEGDQFPYRGEPFSNISIHALREEGDREGRGQLILSGISIHALREEGDVEVCSPGKSRAISIHALREEGDGCGQSCGPAGGDFYPRPPRGGRRTIFSHGVHGLEFLSTPSARRATRLHRHTQRGPEISIHALREEGDPTLQRPWARTTHFYPRPPRGGRHPA